MYGINSVLALLRRQTFESISMVRDEIRSILTSHGRLSTNVRELSDDSDLYEAGLTSLTTVNLLLAIEDHFDIEFPDELLSRRTFRSVNALAGAVVSLTAGD